jgi:hypothetical protein
MRENTYIDVDFYARIVNMMIYRQKDKFPIVRIEAVLALETLQDPVDQDCPVINGKSR